MAFQTFMKVDGVDGECDQSGHEKWIELLGMSWEMSKSIDPSTKLTSGRTRFSDYTVVKAVDLATPQLFKKAAFNELIPNIKIEVLRSGTGPGVKYLEYAFKNCVITKTQLNSGISQQSGEKLPVEVVSFNYQEFQVTYLKQARSTGDTKGQTMASVSLANLEK